MSWRGRLRHRVERLLAEHILRYDTAAFSHALTRLGVSRGDILMVHASQKQNSGFSGRPIDIVRALQEAVGDDGLVVMPSMTYTDSSEAFLQRETAMNVRTSPSKMGLISEVFRRGKGVERSLSPTHPLLVWGGRAAQFVQGHEQTDRPFGPDSPFQRLLDQNAKILCIDAIPETITYTHFLEDRIQHRLTFDLYEPDTLVGIVIDRQGNEYKVPTRVLSDESRARRREDVLWRTARKQRILVSKRVGNTTLSLVGCRELAALLDTLYDQGQSIFELRR